MKSNDVFFASAVLWPNVIVLVRSAIFLRGKKNDMTISVLLCDV